MALLAAAAGGAYWYTHQPPKPGEIEKLPSGSVLKLVGEIPGHAVWKVGGSPAQVVSKEDDAELPLPAGKALPVEVVGTAAGHRTFRRKIEHVSELRQPFETMMERAKGTLLIQRRATCDYGNVSAQMVNPLDTDGEYVQISRITLSKSLPAATSEPVRWELPTGVYQISLVGLRNPVNTRPFQEVTIRENMEVTCELPASFAGDYAGKLSLRSGAGQPSAGSEAQASVSFSDTLAEGKLRYGGDYIMERLRVSSKGVLTAVVKPVVSRRNANQLLTAHLSDDGSQLEVELTDIFEGDGSTAGQPAAGETAPVRFGTLQRISSAEKTPPRGN
jgi:hypothetical protein